MDNHRKEKIKGAIAGGIVLLLILTAVVVVYKYHVEGENDDMPFEISKIVIGSMVVSDDNGQIDSIDGYILQNNGVYIDIQKNENYKDEAVIKSVEIANIKVTEAPIKGEVKWFMPNTKENKKFTYSNEYIIEGDSLTYKGASKNDTTTLEVNNQGGIIAIAFGNLNLGTYSLTTEDLTIDGTILNNMGITDEDIKFSVNFDLIITSGGKKYKTNMTLDLPANNITKKGKASQEIIDTKKYVFKRVVE